MNDHRISRRSFLAAAGLPGAAADEQIFLGPLPPRPLPWHPLSPLLHKQPRAWS